MDDTLKLDHLDGFSCDEQVNRDVSAAAVLINVHRL